MLFLVFLIMFLLKVCSAYHQVLFCLSEKIVHLKVLRSSDNLREIKDFENVYD